MTHSSPPVTPDIPRAYRVVFALMGAVVLALLVTAAILTPDPQGLGTHQQLGLPPCSFRILFDARCPACGMTTSWAHTVRGQLPSALRANVGGTLLAVVALAFGPWALGSGIRGRWLWTPPPERLVIVISLAIVAISLIEWVGRLYLDGS